MSNGFFPKSAISGTLKDLFLLGIFFMSLQQYLHKMRGSTGGSPPRVSYAEIFWSWIGSFVGIAAVTWVHHLVFAGTDLVLMIGSFGASAVLIYGAIHSPLAQPRNLLGGHILSAMIGVACYKLLHGIPGLAEATAVATAIAAMHATRTLHPPGGATALIAVIGSERIHQLGWLYVLIPATLGPLILLVVALLVNNIPAQRRYPEVWR
jgi:CBS-domain-containing membrane protein